jgi:sec-independent protein translocase protein TatA
MFEGLFQPMHLLVIFGIAFLVFGPKKLPELGKGIGEGIRGFKSALTDQQKPVALALTLLRTKADPEGGSWVSARNNSSFLRSDLSYWVPKRMQATLRHVA